jgi:hypothetical protein
MEGAQVQRLQVDLGPVIGWLHVSLGTILCAFEMESPCLLREGLCAHVLGLEYESPSIEVLRWLC